MTIQSDSVYFQVVRDQNTGQSSLSVSVSAPNDLIEQLESLLKSHCYRLMADYAASGVSKIQGAVVFNLPKQQ
ncbi:hypothetical protein LZ012_16610 [Dechloromonas sp. XY25]|uniref:Uncharacterized protein n=1 Tax=Dechloromonas hankyongensis TaxID=2908002 RepID=A0ABS9K653_9RHOO|nr:hypothetical protein [Dechloromonas hankyongensis]MCG2578621.1 hypothetical protein [Dechloromonas hankyongensis]